MCPREQILSAMKQRTIPHRRILFIKRNEDAIGVHTSRTSSLRKAHQRREPPQHFGFVGQQLGQSQCEVQCLR